MTPRQVRSKIAVVATALGLAVLLAGPGSTFGLGVPVVGGSDGATTQVTNTVQSVAETAQQTAATTVTNVESTVQTTAQATIQAAPQPATTTAPATTEQAPTRTAAPVKKQVAAVSAPRTTVQRVAAAKTGFAKQAGGASAAPVRAVERTRAAHSRKVAAPASTTSSATADPPSSCAVSELSLLPGGAQLQALISIVCAATGGIDLPARLGLVHTTDDARAAGGVRGASAHAPAGLAHARASANGVHAIGGTAQRPSAGAAQAAHPGAPLSPASQPGSGAARVYMYAADPSASVPTATTASHASSAAAHHHHTWFIGQTAGTEILMAIIIANLAILAGIALWRLAMRWVIPRFA